LFGELLNPEPQTLVFYVLLAGLVLYAAQRRGRSERDFYEIKDFDSEEVEEYEEDEDDDLPAPVTFEDDDDDLELLEELEEL
jgi:hypothetical protein